jgi:dihydroorotate dehydrogenase electron transfer subunit
MRSMIAPNGGRRPRFGLYCSAMPVDADAEVLASTRLSDDYSVVAFRAPSLAAAIRPGQFVMIRTSPGDTPLLRRPYSVFERVRDAAGAVVGFSIFNKRVGVGSTLLHHATPGMRFACLGPLGRPFSPAPPGSEVWMVAGGTGLAPFETLSEELAAEATPGTIFYGARRASELFRVEPFERRGTRVVLATEDGSRGARGLVTVPLAAGLDARPRPIPVVLRACGPEPMLRAVAALAAEHGCACEVATERQMGCGMGGCYSCVVPVHTPGGGTRYARSCVEGPVFDARDIVWDER